MRVSGANSAALEGGPRAAGMRRPARYQRDGVMASPRECIEFANQCVRLADLCKDDPQLRQHLLELAREWMAMGAQETVDA